MAVRGLDHFSERLAAFREAFVLIGGTACDLWFLDQGLSFRATRDLDVVLILERLTPAVVESLWQYIEDGQYRIKHRSESGPPVLFRFERPTDPRFPHMIELFCRANIDIDRSPGQQIVPIRMDNARSLSAILLNESYYRFLLDHCRVSRGVQAADGVALIPLKARAWLDLTVRKAQGETVKESDINKHRNDVFRLAATLPATPLKRLPMMIANDVNAFLDRFPLEHADWAGILQAVRATVGGTIDSGALITAIRICFSLSEDVSSIDNGV